MINLRLSALAVSDEHASRIRELVRPVGAEKRVLAVDFDGTVVPDHVEYATHQRARELASIIAARNGYYETATVTGSRVSRTQPWADDTRSPLFAENAGVLYDPRMSSSQRINIMTSKEEADFIIQVVAPAIEIFLQEKYPDYTKSDGKHTMATYAFPDVDIEKVYEDVIDFVKGKFPERERDIFITYSYKLFDVNYRDATKARALPILQDFFGVSGPSITFIGDGQNDIPAFEATLQGGGSVIMPANAHGPVLEWHSENKGNPRVLMHELSDTECVYSVVAELHNIIADMQRTAV